MTNRSPKFIAATFASLLAGTSFAAVAEDTVKPADNCLSAPKGTTQAGHHWYYRVDRATKRACWYSREESAKTARALPQDSAPTLQAAPPPAVTKPVSSQQSLLVPQSIADARAELTSPQMRVGQSTDVNVEPQLGGLAAAAGLQNSARATAPDASAPTSFVAQRWPDSAGAINPAGNPPPAAAESPPSPQTNASPAPRPATAPLALTTADAALQEKRTASTQMLLLVMGAALALAGVTASLVFRFGRAQATRPAMRGDRRAIWDQVPAARSSPSMFPDEDTPVWRANVPREVPRDHVPRDPRAPDDPERRVTEMLARLARSAQS
jgi:hypothetical protein